jgi:predicted Rossmann-fold nucleotide-binding protein
MNLAIGVMGSSGGEIAAEVRERAYRLGDAIAAHDAVLVTGACPGLSHEAVGGAKARGGLVVPSRLGCRSTTRIRSRSATD